MKWLRYGLRSHSPLALAASPVTVPLLSPLSLLSTREAILRMVPVVVRVMMVLVVEIEVGLVAMVSGDVLTGILAGMLVGAAAEPLAGITASPAWRTFVKTAGTTAREVVQKAACWPI